MNQNNLSEVKNIRISLIDELIIPLFLMLLMTKPLQKLPSIIAKSIKPLSKENYSFRTVTITLTATVKSTMKCLSIKRLPPIRLCRKNTSQSQPRKKTLMKQPHQ